jgi:hypothetical protein
MPIWGQEYFARPTDDATLQQMQAVFLETTLPFTVKPSIDVVAPYPIQPTEDDEIVPMDDE